MFFVYVIYNKQVDKFYIGQTHDLFKRLEEHNKKFFKGFTSRFGGTWEIVYKEQCFSRNEALAREKQLKSFQGRRFIKENYIPR